MFVEKLSVFGFKSFNQKITLGFEKGISGIIGPNGCGKSNVVDAMRWVLGEQSTKQLRGAKMEDVIFNGARNEKPMSLAQVELTLNNDRGALPVDYTTVTVGRRLYRSGTSEYLINGNIVRLKDVRDLFLDTGMGSHAYSVIERQMVDNILSDTTGHRRFLFEEAAGIMKYKTRKKEALNKLEATERDLLRVNDIITEVERQVASLRRQVSKARRFRALSDEIKGLDLGLSQKQRLKWKTELQTLEHSWRSDSGDAEQAETRVATLDAKLEALHLAVVEEEKRLMEAREALAQVDDELGRAENRSTALRERLQATKEKIQETAEHKVRLADRLERNAVQLTQETERLSELSAREQAEAGKLSGGETNLALAEQVLAEAKEAVEAAMAECARHRDSIGAGRAALATTAGRMEDLEAALLRSGGLAQETEAERESRLAALAGLEEQLKAAQEALSGLDEEQARLDAEWENHTSRLKIYEQEWSHHREADAAVKSRMETLQSLRENYDGFAAGVQALMAGEERAAGVVGTVGDVMRVPSEWLAALEPVLAPAWQYIVVDDAQTAVRLVKRLKDQELGFASLVPLDSVSVKPEPGGDLTWASEVVDTEPRYRSLMRHLLDGLALTTTLDEAMALVRSGQARRAATSGGEFVDGVVLSGGVSGQAPGSELLEREQGLEKCRREIDHLASEMARLQQRKSSLQEEEAEIKEKQEALTSARDSRSAEAVELKQQIKENQMHLDLARETLQKLSGDSDRLGQEVEALQSREEEQKVTLTSAQEALGIVESGYQARVEAGREAEQARESALAALHELRVAWARLEGELRDAKSTHERLTLESEEIRSEQERTAKEAEDASRRRSEIEDETREVADRIQALHQERELKAEVAAEREREKAEAVAREHKDAELVREERRKANLARNRAHEAEVQVTRLRSDLDHLEGRLREDYEVTPEDLDGMDLPPLSDSASRDLAELRDRLRRLGPVNHMALEEFEEKSERFDFMSTQRDDLLRAKESLERTIIEINKKASGMFLETFALVQENFQKTFQVLFQGGECSLDLIGDDPLEAEIEVTARPRGKRPQSIAQLSSGERALTAIALLFAIYLVKPSPFCILDEVDAPLDDANIDRFVAMIKEFSKRTQFIMITHNKKTMEAADCLYGITMQRPGVSSVVSVRLDGGPMDEEARVALEGAEQAEDEERAQRAAKKEKASQDSESVASLS